MTDKILAFIPCYNCAPQIGRVLQQFRGPVAARIHEVLVLDNGSRDGTVDQAVKAAADVETGRVVVGSNRANYNLGGSHKAAFQYAVKHGFTHVLILHGDDQGSLNDIEPILAQGLHRTNDACLGARFARGSRLIGYSAFRIFGNHVFNTLFTLGTGRKVADLGSGLNIVGSAVFGDPSVTRYADDLRFNIFLLLGLFDARRRVMFFPISWREDDQVSNVKMTSQALRTLSMLVDHTIWRKKFKETDARTVKHESYDFDVVFTKDLPA